MEKNSCACDATAWWAWVYCLYGKPAALAGLQVLELCCSKRNTEGTAPHNY